MTAGAIFEREILQQADVTRAQAEGDGEAVRSAAAAITRRARRGS